jgi:hypothetical protein
VAPTTAAVLRQHVAQAVSAAEQQRQGAVSVESALQQMQQVRAMLASQVRTQTSAHDAVSRIHTGTSSCAGGGITSGLCAYGSREVDLCDAHGSATAGGGIVTGGYLYGRVIHGSRSCI